MGSRRMMRRDPYSSKLQQDRSGIEQLFFSLLIRGICGIRG